MSERRKYGGLAFAACLFICIGIGLAFGRPDVGAIIGVGLGFISMIIVNIKIQPK